MGYCGGYTRFQRPPLAYQRSFRQLVYLGVEWCFLALYELRAL